MLPLPTADLSKLGHGASLTDALERSQASKHPSSAAAAQQQAKISINPFRFHYVGCHLLILPARRLGGRRKILIWKKSVAARAQGFVCLSAGARNHRRARLGRRNDACRELLRSIACTGARLFELRLALASELQRRFGRRVRLAEGHGKWQRPPMPMSQTEQAGEQGKRVATAHKASCQEDGDICDLVLFSKVSTRFTLERIMDRVGSHVVTIWASDECISETTEARDPRVQHEHCRICRDEHGNSQQADSSSLPHPHGRSRVILISSQLHGVNPCRVVVRETTATSHGPARFGFVEEARRFLAQGTDAAAIQMTFNTFSCGAGVKTE